MVCDVGDVYIYTVYRIHIDIGEVLKWDSIGI
jgi:hypothetical protein